MMLCLCHPFSDKKVKSMLDDSNAKTNVSSVYRECSGGNSPQCCTCLETLKDMVKTHNKSVAA